MINDIWVYNWKTRSQGSSIIIAAQKAMYIYIFKLNLYKEKGSWKGDLKKSYHHTLRSAKNREGRARKFNKN